MMINLSKQRIVSLVLVTVMIFSIFGEPITINKDQIAPSYSVSSFNDNLSLIKGTHFKGNFSESQISERRTYLLFYLEFNRSGVHELKVTMPKNVDRVVIEIKTSELNRTIFPNRTIFEPLFNSELTSFYFTPTQVVSFYIRPELDLSEEFGLTLIVYFNEFYNDDTNAYVIKLKEIETPKKMSGSFTSIYNDTTNSKMDYFSLDLEKLGITEANFYNLSLNFEFKNATLHYNETYPRQYSARADFSLLGPASWDYQYYFHGIGPYFYYLDDIGYSKILFLDPHIKYDFKLFYSCSLYWFVHSLEFNFSFQAKKTPITPINEDKSISILPHEQRVLKMDVPIDHCSKLLANKVGDFEVEILSKDKSHSYFEFYDSSLKNNYFNSLELTRVHIDNMGTIHGEIANSDKSSSIITGGLISHIQEEYKPETSLEYSNELKVNSLEIFLPANESIYVFISTSFALEINYVCEPIVEFSSKKESYNLLKGNSLQMYKYQVSNPSFIGSTCNNNLDQTIKISSETKLYLPGNLITVPRYFKNYTPKNGSGLIICFFNYTVYSSNQLGSSRIRNEIANTQTSCQLTPYTLPEVKNILNTELTQTDPFKLYQFPISEGEMINFTIGYWLLDSTVEIIFIDSELGSPFFGKNVFNNDIGMSITLMGKKNTTAFLILTGQGKISLSIERLKICDLTNIPELSVEETSLELNLFSLIWLSTLVLLSKKPKSTNKRKG